MHSVYIADDERPLREMLRIILEAEGYAVEERATGNAMIALLAQPDTAPHLLLLDMQMPDGDGLAVLSWLAAHPLTAQRMRVLVVTAQPQPLPSWTQPLVEDVILKPFPIDLLLQRVARPPVYAQAV